MTGISSITLFGCQINEVEDAIKLYKKIVRLDLIEEVKERIEEEETFRKNRHE